VTVIVTYEQQDLFSEGCMQQLHVAIDQTFELFAGQVNTQQLSGDSDDLQ